MSLNLHQGIVYMIWVQIQVFLKTAYSIFTQHCVIPFGVIRGSR